MSASQFPPLQSTPSTKHCTNCSTLMSLYTLPGHYGNSVAIDVCHNCNALWFDQSESTQLSPDGTVALFQLINERGGAASTASSKFGEGLRCVTCGTGMRLTNDRVKNTRFAYQSCPMGHGRLTTFYNFLSEKQFVRELTSAERAKLAVSVQQIKCSSCAAPVDIGKTDACQYCRAPVSVFDRDAAKKAIDHYLAARQRQPAQPSSSSANYGYNSSSADAGSVGYNGIDLAADILFALGRAATRGVGYAGSRAVPAAVGAGAGSALADGGSTATGGLLDSIGAGAGSGAGASFGGASNALPTASDALFGSSPGSIISADSASNLTTGLGSSIITDTDGITSLGDALPSATDALFGSASSAAMTDSTSGLLNEFGNLFSGAASSGSIEGAAGIGSGVIDSVGSSAFDAMGDMAGDAASSAGGGLVDLVSDGMGSLLGSLFS